MKILIGCDVDPVLPAFLTSAPENDVWACLDEVERLRQAAERLPVITWLIRSDESVRFATGQWDSGYVRKRSMWESLRAAGHELGWHMHLASFDRQRGCFGFDAKPVWLPEAHHALAAHYVVKATRTGWDYANDFLLNQLDALGITVDFSALPGCIAWHRFGHDRICVDWSRCPKEPYHPSEDDYQRPGRLNILEIPNTQFPNPWPSVAKRIGWRLKNGSYSLRGLGVRTKLLTEPWGALPTLKAFAAFYFHPEDLAGDGLQHLLRNVEMLRNVPGAEFVTASAAADAVSSSPSPHGRDRDEHRAGQLAARGHGVDERTN